MTADEGRLETMTHAADALLSRVTAGRSQLSSAVLQCDIKQSVIDDTLARLTHTVSHEEFTVCISQLCLF